MTGTNHVTKTTSNGKWCITWVPGRCGYRRGWLEDVTKGHRFTFSVTNGRVSYMRVVEPKNVPKYVDLEILEKAMVEK